MKPQYTIYIRFQNDKHAGFLLRIADKKIEYWDDFNGRKKKIDKKDPERLKEIQELLNFAYQNAARIIEESTELP
tara:strand:- start:231 stop:455 length:225 start_codon:yes stop_codon:yes gene_type:complete